MNDTIAAVATALGEGGIGIVRVSGPAAARVAGRLFRSRGGDPLESLPPFRLALGTVADPRTGELIDEVFAVRMPEGRSYTGESVVEIQAHGGRAVLEAILAAAVAAGARHAQPGEFTRRAFLAGRLDLAQAEAVAGLIAAGDEEERRLALRQLRGEVGREIRALRGRLVDVAAEIEALLDFGEEEGGAPAFPHADLKALAGEIDQLARRGREGRGAGDRPRVVIAGRPNSGKSTIFNVLCGRDRSIVTADPGTTRDYIEETVRLDGVRVILTDTAGIRDGGDAAEREGIRRSLARIAGADLVVLLVDGSEPVDGADLALVEELRERNPIIVVTKVDLAATIDPATAEGLARGLGLFRVSSLTGEGVPAFAAALADRCRERVRAATVGVVPGARHADALERAARHLQGALGAGCSAAPPTDLAATEVRSALAALGEITGETATEELVDRIFSRFCVGK